MRIFILIFSFFGIYIACTAYAAKSFIPAQSFPKTFEDVSFTDKLAVKTEGYDRFSTLSAYDQLELEGLHEDLAKQMSRDMADEDISDDSQDDKNDEDDLPIGYCAQKHPNIPKNQTIPFGSPVLHEHFVYCSPYGMVDRGKGPRAHVGYDIGCTLKSHGRPVFTAADGVVSLVKRNRQGSSAGNYIRIDHENGFQTYYMHLDTMLVSQGQKVSAGCQIATIGNTGTSKETRNKNDPDPHFRKEISHVHYQMTYTGNKTFVKSANGKTLRITHGWPNSTDQITKNSIDPTQFICVYANFTTGYCGSTFPYQ